MDPALAQALIERARELGQAEVVHQLTNRESTIRRIPIDLGTAQSENKPFRIGFPFKTAYIEDLSSPDGYFYLKPSGLQSAQGYVRMGLGDVFQVDLVISEAFLHWDAQPGVTGTLVVLTDASLRAGRLLSVNAGGVSINEGASSSLLTPITLTATTTTQLLAQDLFRKVVSVQNRSGADLWVGDATVTNTGATEGILVPSNAIVEWRNTGPLYGFSVGGGKVTFFEEV